MLQEKQALREEMCLAFEGAVGQLSGTNVDHDLYLYMIMYISEYMYSYIYINM
jgi:hypothetical protein